MQLQKFAKTWSLILGAWKGGGSVDRVGGQGIEAEYFICHASDLEVKRSGLSQSLILGNERLQAGQPSANTKTEQYSAEWCYYKSIQAKLPRCILVR